MKRLADFESIQDFGFDEVGSGARSKPEFIFCDNSLSKSLGQLNIILDDSQRGSIGRYESLESIYSGGGVNVQPRSYVDLSQAKLAIDYTEPQSLGYLGSVYSVVASAINNITENYPNGFLIINADTGVGNTLIFDHNQSYTYGRQFNTSSAYTGFALYSLLSNIIQTSYSIVAVTGGTGQTTFELDGTPPTGATWSYAVYPTTENLQNFYKTISDYEYDLVVPPYGRDNYVPRDSAVSQNLVLVGTDYDDFVETELDWAEGCDNENSNFLWRKLYPDGQKQLDSNDNLMYKLIVSYGKMFDQIKNYQDQLQYMHTIDYGNYDHIPKSLVNRLCGLWNISISESFLDEYYYQYIFDVYDNYVTGNTLQSSVSGEYLEFEVWRRILTNIIYLYKKKGTLESVKYLFNIFSIPENLLSIKELIGIEGNFVWSDGTTPIIGNKETAYLPSLILIQTGNKYEYIDDNGAVSAFTATSIINNRKLTIDVSVYNAMESDFYSWGWDNHPRVYGPDGLLKTVSSTTQPNQFIFENRIQTALVRSDGMHRYAENYPELAAEFFVYKSGDPDYVTPASLKSYVDFLDNSWTQTVGKLIPASSSVVGIGETHRNPWWHREKYKWQVSELDPVELPFQSGMVITHVYPSVSKNAVYSGAAGSGHSIPSARVSVHNVDILTGNSFASTKKTLHSATVLTGYSLPTSRVSCYASEIDTYVLSTEQTNIPSDIISMDIVETGLTETLGSPLLVPISGQYGTTTFIDYDSNATVVTNNNTVDIVFSASNLSTSGYTKFNIELFKSNQNVSLVDEDYEYSIIKSVRESYGSGIYKISSLINLDAGTNLVVRSGSYDPWLNTGVTITSVNELKNTITTFPEIGFWTSPGSFMGAGVDWLKYVRSYAFEIIDGVFYDLYNQSNVVTPTLYVSFLNDMYNMHTDVYNIETPSLDLMKNVVNRYFPTYTNRLAPLFMDIGKNNNLGSINLLNHLRQNANRINISNGEVKIIEHYLVSLFNGTKAYRSINYFDWNNPDQSIEITNLTSTTMSGWSLPVMVTDLAGRKTNTYSITGTVSVGGLNSLYADILKDKEEYFLRYKATTHCPSGWTEQMTILPVFSGINLIEGEYDKTVYNGIRYYGNYFLYLNTPKEPNLTSYPEDSTATTLDSASVTVKWNGVSDATRLEVQFWNNGTSDASTLSAYTQIADGNWATAITINVAARQNVADDYTYTQQTTLEPDTYYWWRVKNFRGKLNMFGHNLESYISTQPYAFKTGSFTDSGESRGEIPSEPEAPIGDIRVDLGG